MFIKPAFRIVRDNTNIKFMKGRIAGLVTSAILSIASVGLFFYPGLNLGIDFSGGMSSVVSQLNAALGSSALTFSNPSGNTLQVVNSVGSGLTINSASTTTTATSLTGGSAQLPLFTDAGSTYTGAITGAGSEMTGFAERIQVNPALLANPANLTVYSNSPTTPLSRPTSWR